MSESAQGNEIIHEIPVASDQGLDQLDLDLVELEQGGANAELIGRVFRCVHTTKGICRFLGFGRRESIAHVGGLRTRQLSPPSHSANLAESRTSVSSTDTLASLKSNKLNDLANSVTQVPCGTAPALLKLDSSLFSSRPRMSHQLVIDLSRQAIMTALMIAAPMLLIALGVGLVVSIIQSVTQIQEQTLAFVPKLVLVGGAFIVGMPWLLQILIRYTTELFRGIPAMVG